MNIAIIGTRGIPNNYGGFEQCAQKISRSFVRRGHAVTVYNPSDHPYEEDEFEGVKIRRVFSRERALGPLNVFVFDYLCFRDAIRRDFDIILVLGYSPAALYFGARGKSRARIVTNMDGLEWKRSKWSGAARSLLRYSEGLAALKSDALVSDNPGIRDYIFGRYRRDSFFIPYGAEIPGPPDEGHLKRYGVDKFGYFMLMARLEPENNTETILEGYVLSDSKLPFIVVGNWQTKYGRFLKKKYGGRPGVRFVGAVYDYGQVSSLRGCARVYFHGHSVGGTNPSLIEAMASRAFIAAHDNVFNRHVLGTDGFYFGSPSDVAGIINRYTDDLRQNFAENNMRKVREVYDWEVVSGRYLEVFERVLGE